MYSRLKTLIRRLLPKSLFFRFEPLLRNIHYNLFYRGSNCYCNVCDKKLRAFIVLSSGNLICPCCGSSDRDRRLFNVLSEKFIGKNLKHLDFSPSRSLFRKLNRVKDHRYIASDISGDFIAHKQFDIVNIEVKEESFDLITCYHILEHVENDLRAMAELYRVLKSGGSCIIQTPFKDGEIYEDFTIKSPNERLIHFGQEDHVRVYSLLGLKDRLEKIGFDVKVLSFSDDSDNQMGYKMREEVLICNKP